MGIDCSPHYTRYLGVLPVEQMSKDDLDYVNKLKSKMIEPKIFKII
jgi:hypothetical protein